VETVARLVDRGLGRGGAGPGRPRPAAWQAAPVTDAAAPGGPEDSRGQRLADWLDGLGLTDQLPAAGLPVVERDPTGRAHWTDPGTGEPLGEDALEALDDLLHHQGSEPEHAVPLALLQLARQARLRAELRASPTHDYASLARLRGASVEATRFAVHKLASRHLLLVVPVEAGVLVPGFQLTAGGEPRPDLVPLLTPLLAAGGDPWRTWAWLTRPAALLSGLVPADAAADPGTADLAAWGAVRLAELTATAR